MKVLAPNSSVTLTVVATDNQGENDTHDWTFTSSDPAIVGVTKMGPNTATVSAGGMQHTEAVITMTAGAFSTTELVVVDDTTIAAVSLEWS